MRGAGIAVAIALCTPAAARAQQCDTVWSRTSLAEVAGRTIRDVRVETRGTDALPGIAGAFDRLHVTTREGTIRRLLLVAPGEPVDTLRVAESLRRLRHLRYLGDAVIGAASCDGGPVDLTVITRDLWSAKPTAQIRSTRQSIGVTERNAFGTGREATIGLRSDASGVGVTLGMADPWFLGRDVSLNVNAAGDGERGSWLGVMQNHEHSLLDPWAIETHAGSTALTTQTVDTTGVPIAGIEALRRTRAGVLGTRRLHASSSAVVGLIGGVEYDRLAWETKFGTHEAGVRDFVGADIGVRRRSVAYDTLTWMLPGSALVDVPLSTDADVLVGGGRDRVAGAAATRVDAWVGRMWQPTSRSLLVTDAWGSGYRGSGLWTDATLRAALTFYHAAARGLWTVRVDGEKWFASDPDVIELVTADPTIRAYTDRSFGLGRVASASLDREVRLRQLSRSWWLDGAAFVAASDRGVGRVALVGFGLRMAPARLGRATARLDFAVPVAGSGAVRNRPFIAIGITPWLEQDRMRDGRLPR